MPTLSPTDLYPVGAGCPAYTLLDVRAPVEAAAGALPGAVLQPILSDEERHLIGLRYQEAGQEAAIKLGYALTEPHLPGRIEAWREVAAQGPTAVTCWRGGLRSKLTTEFIGDDRVARVEGGYKAVRAYLMGQLEPSLERYEPVVIGGLTGSGKTALLKRLQGVPDLQVLDLEHEARHRGSAFGRLAEPQPAQATFENSVAAQLLLGRGQRLVLEDESRTIGRIELPDPLHEVVQTSPVVLVEEPLDNRVARIHQDYVLSLSRTLGVAATRHYLSGSLLRLKKRLSGAVTDAALESLADAERSGNWSQVDAHRGWITPLLELYYDPLYRKGLAKSGRPVVFTGDLEACHAWLTQ